MAFRKPCARTLDRPIVIFGLEPEEFVLVGIVSGAILFVIDAIPAVLTGAILWVGLSRVKAGKPPGHLFELAYRSGWLDRAPAGFTPPHLLPRRARTLDAFDGETHGTLRRYWGDRPRLDP